MDHRVTTQEAPHKNRDKASTTLTHPTTTHTRPLKGGTPHILHLNPSSFRHRSKVCGRGGGGEGKVEPYTTSFQSPLNNCEVSALGKPSSNSCCRHLGIARKGGGGLNPCPDGLGHFFREEFAKIKWAFAWFWGGLNPCQDGLGHLCSEN